MSPEVHKASGPQKMQRWGSSALSQSRYLLPCAGSCCHFLHFKVVLERHVRNWEREGKRGQHWGPAFPLGNPRADWAAFQNLPAFIYQGALLPCLLAFSVISPLPSPESISFLLLFTSVKPCVTHFRLQLGFTFCVAGFS